jgi:peptide/nickel transport system ATP-binding protein
MEVGSDALLQIDELRTQFFTPDGVVRAVDGVTLHIQPGETLGLVGESGCGKSVTAQSILRLLPPKSSRLTGGAIRFRRRDGQQVDLAQVDPRGAAIRGIRGNEIAMIFQEPMTSLSPVHTIGAQLAEVAQVHDGLTKHDAYERAQVMLSRVGIANPGQRLYEYPHQFSGGMRQRAMIAMALACNPKVLIADEPTTALDVTIQAQILDIILELQRQLGTAVILITHDLGVVAETAQRVIVMYAGRKVEEAPVEDLFARPQHPYTHGLLASIPRVSLMRGVDDVVTDRLREIPGMVPALTNLPAGCVFAPRCAFAEDRCRKAYPDYEKKRPDHWAACWRSEELYGDRDG